MDTTPAMIAGLCAAAKRSYAELRKRLAALSDDEFSRLVDAVHPAMTIWSSACREAAVRQMRSADLPAAERAAAACRVIDDAREAYRREKESAAPRPATLSLIARRGRALAAAEPPPAPDVIETMRAQLAGAKTSTGGSEA